LFSSLLLVILFTSLGIFSSLGLSLLLSLLDESLSRFSELGISALLLEDGFRDVLLGLFDLH